MTKKLEFIEMKTSNKCLTVSKHDIGYMVTLRTLVPPEQAEMKGFVYKEERNGRIKELTFNLSYAMAVGIVRALLAFEDVVLDEVILAKAIRENFRDLQNLNLGELKRKYLDYGDREQAPQPANPEFVMPKPKSNAGSWRSQEHWDRMLTSVLVMKLMEEGFSPEAFDQLLTAFRKTGYSLN